MNQAAFPLRFEFAIPKVYTEAGELTFDEYRAALQRWASDISDFTPFWNDYFLPSWYALMLRRYGSQGAFSGDAWAALSARYGAWKAKRWPGKPIGVLTGDTKDSLTSPAGQFAITKATPNSLGVGSTLEHAFYLQTGTRRMPRRPPMQIDDAFMQDVARLLQRFAADKAKAARLAGQ